MKIGSKMEQYMALAKGAKGKSLEALVPTILADNEVWIFGEILELDNVKAVSIFPHRFPCSSKALLPSPISALSSSSPTAPTWTTEATRRTTSS